MNDKFKTEFKEIRRLGKGGFSTVFEVMSYKDGKSYAIKKIPIKEDERKKSKKEIEILRNLNTEFVVYYIDSWIEQNYYISNKNEYEIDSESLLFNPNKSLLLHIQMELCSLSLGEYVQLTSGRQKNTITTRQYSKSCEIFIQILNCVQYLHDQRPPIIHRDLKPENIMLIDINDNYKVKLTDFGLSTYHYFVDEAHTKYIGTVSYRAPEIDDAYYDTKADIYSLGKVMERLFNFKLNDESNNNDYEIQTQYSNARRICLKCVSYSSTERPTCIQILKEIHKWNYIISEKNSNGIKLQSYFWSALSPKIPNKFKTSFKTISAIGSENFPTVFKCQKKENNNFYAIKKICLKKDDHYKLSNEIKIVVNLKTEFIMQFIDYWVEDNYYLKSKQTSDDDHYIRSESILRDNRFPLLLHIQMELCALTLNDVIIELESCTVEKNTITIVGYFVVSNLIRELLEGVDYLHRQKPPVIHRNLKPGNLLISNFVNNRCVKLTDFGLTTYHETTKYIGSASYRAPELFYTKKYSTKVDNYSLGVIMRELSNIDILSYYNKNYDEILKTKISNLASFIIKSLHFKADRRPNCDEILENQHNWCFFSDVLLKSEFRAIINKPKSSLEENFIEYFIQNKIISD